MILLGLLISLAFIPGYTGVTGETTWAALSCVLPLTLWRKGEFTLLHWLGASFLAYACLSLAWANDPYDGVYGLWLVAIWALCFWLGSTTASLRRLYIGLALGLSISSAVSVGQWLGYHPVLQSSGDYPGLLYNKMIHGEAIALVIVALVTERLWWYVPTLLPGLYLANSRVHSLRWASESSVCSSTVRCPSSLADSSVPTSPPSPSTSPISIGSKSGK